MTQKIKEKYNVKKTVLILTKSAKTGGYCVAGIDVNTRQWIRLVTDNEEVHHSLTDENMVCSNGRVCDKLDVVEVDFIGNAPSPHQPENKLINQAVPFCYLYSYEDIEQALRDLNIVPDNPPYIYGNSSRRISDAEIDSCRYSLCLVKVHDLQIQNSATNGKRNKVGFAYRNNTYHQLSMTDRDYYFRNSPDSLTEAYIVVSIPTVPFEFDNQYYKFVSAIYPSVA